MKSILAFAALTIAIVSAQVNIISVTSPLTGTVYTAGQSATISWINAKVDTISKIVLAKGSPSALEPLNTIAENVDATAGSFIWNIPADTPAGNDYALEFGTSPDLSFAGLFTIKNDANAPSSSSSFDASSNSSTPTPSSSSATASASVTHSQETHEKATNVTASDAAKSRSSASPTNTSDNSASTGSRESLNKVAMIVSLIGSIAAVLA